MIPVDLEQTQEIVRTYERVDPAAPAANEWAEAHSPPGSHPLHVRTAFLAGVQWARENP